MYQVRSAWPGRMQQSRKSHDRDKHQTRQFSEYHYVSNPFPPLSNIYDVTLASVLTCKNKFLQALPFLVFFHFLLIQSGDLETNLGPKNNKKYGARSRPQPLWG